MTPLFLKGALRAGNNGDIGSKRSREKSVDANNRGHRWKNYVFLESNVYTYDDRDSNNIGKGLIYSTILSDKPLYEYCKSQWQLESVDSSVVSSNADTIMISHLSSKLR